MKILYIISSLENVGPVNVLYALCAEMAVMHQVNVLTLSPEKQNSRWHDFSALPIELQSLKLSRSQFVCHGWTQFELFLHDKNFDVIHSHGIRADKLVAKLSSADMRTVRFSTAHNYPMADYRATYGQVLGWVMTQLQFHYWQRIGNVIACSRYIGQQIEQQLPTIQVSSIHNGTLSASRAVQRNAKENESINLLVLGSISKRKNTQYLLDCVQHLAPRLKRIKLVLVGDGPLFERLKHQYASNRIVFKGYAKRPELFLQKSDWLISASTSEGCPMAVLEALSLNCNLLLSDIGPHVEIERIVNDDTICRTFPLTQDHELAAILLGIDREEIGWHDGAYNAWKSHFSASVMTNNYLKSYLTKLDEGVQE